MTRTGLLNKLRFTMSTRIMKILKAGFTSSIRWVWDFLQSTVSLGWNHCSRIFDCRHISKDPSNNTCYLYYLPGDMPKRCKDNECYMAVRKGDCDDLKKKHHKDDKKTWNRDKTGFSTNIDGRAAGVIWTEKRSSLRRNQMQGYGHLWSKGQ